MCEIEEYWADFIEIYTKSGKPVVLCTNSIFIVYQISQYITKYENVIEFTNTMMFQKID